MCEDEQILTGAKLEEAKKWMKLAAELAKDSCCKRSKRGVVIIKYGKCVGEGVNGPVAGKGTCQPCIREKYDISHKTRYELCNGEHAEQAAIDDALMKMIRVSKKQQRFYGPKGSTMYHIALALEKNGSWKPRPSGKPSCTLCSIKILKHGISDVVLWHSNGTYVAYSSHHFHKLSLTNMLKVFLDEQSRKKD